jgi:hypothetical protein
MEKEMIEASFARFLNSFQFPITIYIQTREMDMQTYLERLQSNINETCETFPGLANYGKDFYKEMQRLPELTGNSKQKKKFIIVGYEEAFGMDELNDDEKRSYSITELNLRVQVLIDNLSGMGIKATELDTAGLLELMYSTYHKDDYSNFENLLTGEYTTLMAGFAVARDEQGNLLPYININPVALQDDVKRAENALWNAKNIIKTEILDRDGLDEGSQELYQAVIDRLEELTSQMKEVLSQDEGGNR